MTLPRITARRGIPRVGARILGGRLGRGRCVTLVRPQAVARLVSGTGTAPDAAVIRILGGRQLLQGPPC